MTKKQRLRETDRHTDKEESKKKSTFNYTKNVKQQITPKCNTNRFCNTRFSVRNDFSMQKPK